MGFTIYCHFVHHGSGNRFFRNNLIETVSNKALASLPEWFNKWEATGLITHEDKNQDGLIQYVADPQLNELKVDADIMVLANPEIADLPNWVIAIMAARSISGCTINRCRFVVSNFLLCIPRLDQKNDQTRCE